MRGLAGRGRCCRATFESLARNRTVTLHLVGLAHSEATGDFAHCAYTQRTKDFGTLLARADIPVTLYSAGESESEAPQVQVVTSKQRRALWPSYEPAKHVFNDFDPALPGWQVFNGLAAVAIRERMVPGDILGITMGTSQRPIAEALPRLLPVEVGIGYSGVWAPFRVFESRPWQHYMAAREPRDDMRAYDEVIPRGWLAEDFPAGDGSGGYALFMGRLMARKGPHVAADAAARAGIPLKVAGQGVRSWSRSLIVCEDGTELRGDVEYLGVLGPRERAEVMGEALAILTPTQYFEPLGGVSIEAQLTGTPAIVSNWGGLPENIIEGQTGFACDLLRDYARGIEQAASLDRGFIRDHAVATWSIEALAPRWTAYLDRLATLTGAGWYSE